jgi:hypothetical protein
MSSQDCGRFLLVDFSVLVGVMSLVEWKYTLENCSSFLQAPKPLLLNPPRPDHAAQPTSSFHDSQIRTLRTDPLTYRSRDSNLITMRHSDPSIRAIDFQDVDGDSGAGQTEVLL